jgi:hypothetical protein
MVDIYKVCVSKILVSYFFLKKTLKLDVKFPVNDRGICHHYALIR